jgi:UDP-N-acetylmuramate dehydrogenase
MQQIVEQHPLTNYNTLGLLSISRYFIELTAITQLSKINDYINRNHLKYIILGGGSNIILPVNYAGLVIHNKLTGIELLNFL